jgi:hypothetical protein
MYIDGLLHILADTVVGCYIDSHFLGALAYRPTPIIMFYWLKPKLLFNEETLERKIIIEIAKDVFILCNAGKSKCIFFPKSLHVCIRLSSIHLPFSIGDILIKYVLLSLISVVFYFLIYVMTMALRKDYY